MSAVALALSMAAVTLSGCASSLPSADATTKAVVSAIPAWAGGEPDTLPKAPANPPAAISVYQPPSTRASRPLTAEEQKKLTADLAAARGQADQKVKTAVAADKERARQEALAAARNRLATGAPMRAPDAN
jgi:hypothetical protein